ncbi:hypothetical protein ACFSHQ_21635 [Gemmobacter lanyuensis]
MSRILALILWFLPTLALGAPLSRDEIAGFILPPYALGPAVNDQGVWSLRNSGGAEAGYVFETAPLAPCPAFPAVRSTCWCCWILRGASSMYG